jgi:A/G-specific adenine glycosylase
MKLAAVRVRRKSNRPESAPSAPRPVAKPDAPFDIGARLLGWYDLHRRRLPWRAEPGERADPYVVWLSEIMLQQTTVKTVAPYFERFTARWPDAAALASAPLDDVLQAWAGLGYYARARNLHRCAQAVAEHWGGRFPDTEAELRALPGIGRYTAAAIAAIAFGRRATPVDGNIERIVARLFAVAEPAAAAKPRIQALAESITPSARAGDFAQALMDVGATICTPRLPHCPICPLAPACAARQSGSPESFPQRASKRNGALRRGAAFVVARADGCILLRRRPPSGLLGGMSEVPTSAWTAQFDPADALAEAPVLTGGVQSMWRAAPGVVRHVFTHFPLELTVFTAYAPTRMKAPAGMRWVPRDRLPAEALPTLMRKVIIQALGEGA